ncbi:MAG: hypothetical protein LBU85_09870 [Treponema sp.]|jgi:hypothetical protein|nr:hypothetical protein [Treponema sp.]
MAYISKKRDKREWGSGIGEWGLGIGEREIYSSISLIIIEPSIRTGQKKSPVLRRAFAKARNF